MFHNRREVLVVHLLLLLDQLEELRLLLRDELFHRDFVRVLRVPVLVLVPLQRFRQQPRLPPVRVVVRVQRLLPVLVLPLELAQPLLLPRLLLLFESAARGSKIGRRWAPNGAAVMGPMGINLQLVDPIPPCSEG